MLDAEECSCFSVTSEEVMTSVLISVLQQQSQPLVFKTKAVGATGHEGNTYVVHSCLFAGQVANP